MFFRHVMVGANDLKESKQFYDAIFGVLGLKAGTIEENKCRWFGEGGQFLIKLPINGDPATHGNGGTIGFEANTSEVVDSWYAAGLSNGGICITPPEVSDRGARSFYLAYLRDPVGNKLCAAHELTK